MDLKQNLPRQLLTLCTLAFTLLSAQPDSKAQLAVRPGGTIPSAQRSAEVLYDTTVTVHLQAGWNLVSLPVNVRDSSLGSNFPPYSHAFGYQAGAEAGYFLTSELESGKGYWLRASSSDTLSITGSVRLVDTIDVSPGWNLVGALSRSFIPKDGVTLRVIPSGRAVIAQYPPCDWAIPCEQGPASAFWVKIIADSARPQLILSAE